MSVLGYPSTASVVQGSSIDFHLCRDVAGGKSLYGFNSGGEANRANKVSFDRPFYNGYGPQTNGAEEKLIRWLENEGIPVECCSSDDLHSNSTLLAAYDCLVLAGHDE